MRASRPVVLCLGFRKEKLQIRTHANNTAESGKHPHLQLLRLNAIRSRSVLVVRLDCKSCFSPRSLAEMSHVKVPFPVAGVRSRCNFSSGFVAGPLERVRSVPLAGHVSEDLAW